MSAAEGSVESNDAGTPVAFAAPADEPDASADATGSDAAGKPAIASASSSLVSFAASVVCATVSSSPLLGARSSAGTSEAPWDAKAMNELLRRGMFDPLYQELLHRHEVTRCSLAASWCEDVGIRGGHVPLLYVFVRNGCRHVTGCVLPKDIIERVLTAFVLLVLRIVQDTVALQRAQGLRVADSVYRVLVTSKLRPWLNNIRPLDAWPSLREVLDSLSQSEIVKDVTKLPDHSWITALRYTQISTVRFGTPDHDLRLACQGSTDAISHRADVRNHFFSVATPMEWNNFLSAPLEMFIPRVRK